MLSRLEKRVIPQFRKARKWYRYAATKIVPIRSGGERHSLPGDLVISLTSYPPRFGTLPATLKCLLNQDMKPDRIILWIAEADRNKLTPGIKALGGPIDIKFCEDIRSYKKLIPTLREENKSFIVTVDDDIFYERSWLSSLIKEYNPNVKEALCRRARRIYMNERGKPAPYNEWGVDVEPGENTEFIFPVGFRGILYPPLFFSDEVLNNESFMKIAPEADDIWFYWMGRKNGGRFRKVGSDAEAITWPRSQKIGLWESNSTGGNNKTIERMISAYGLPF